MKRLIYAAGIASAALLPAAAAKAQDASWGCQVLLCAASQNPSWHGVQYCIPPMIKLIAAMSKPGFSWPICNEANAGAPGREDYADCPEGTKIGYSQYGRDGNRGVADRCVKTLNTCQTHPGLNGPANQAGVILNRRARDGDDSCIKEISSPRPRRADPWYFDIPNDQGVKQRHWFNLNL